MLSGSRDVHLRDIAAKEGDGSAFAPLGPVAEDMARRLRAEKARMVSPSVLFGLFRTFEASAIAGAGAAAYFAWVVEPRLEMAYLAIAALTAAMASILFESVGLYRLASITRFAQAASRLAAAWTGIVAVLIVAAFFTKLGADFSRAWLAIWWGASLAVLLTGRATLAATARSLMREGKLQRRAIIIGGGDPAATLVRAIEADPDNGIRICGIFDDRSDERSPAKIAGHRKLGTVRELASFARSAEIDLLIMALPPSAENRLLEILRRLWVLPADIRISAQMSRLRLRPHTYSFIGDVPLLDVVDKPLDDWGRVLKAVEDRVLAALCLALALPVMALVALAIKIESRGPVLFRQRRYGFNNELIEVLKFRSMYLDRCDANASLLVTRRDPRVTRVGAFIRRTSLDELPQLINVLRGELAMVGPRPHATGARAGDMPYEQVVDGYFVRHKVKPGITGWAQVNGWRGETDTADKIVQRVEHDLYYIENWSVLFDLYILAITPLSLITTDKAY